MPRACMSSRAPSRPKSSTVWIASGSMPCSASASRMARDERRRWSRSAAEPPRSTTALPRSQRERRDVDRHVRPRLVDRADDARTARATFVQPHPVRQRALVEHAADRIGQRRDIAHGRGEGGDPRRRRAGVGRAAPSERPLVRPRSRSSALAATIPGAADSMAPAMASRASRLRHRRAGVRRWRAASWASSMRSRAVRARCRGRGHLAQFIGGVHRARSPWAAAATSSGREPRADIGRRESASSTRSALVTSTPTPMPRRQPRGRDLGRRAPGSDAVRRRPSRTRSRRGRRRTAPCESARRPARPAGGCRGTRCR